MVFYLVAILVLGVLIVVHEFGHFIVAKKLGISVLKFSVGFGPTIFGRTVNGTEYALSAIPLGGFVKMAGEDPDSTEEVTDPSTSFSHAALWRRTAIVSAGPLFNIVFAFVTLVCVFWFFGEPRPSEAPRIGSVSPGMAAAAAGLEAGDLVQSVDGKPVATWKELSEAIRSSGGREVAIVFTRGTEQRTVSLQPREEDEKTIFGEVKGKAYLIGILPATESSPVGLVSAVRLGAQQTVSLSGMIVTGLAKMVQGKISKEDIGGPILIVKQAKQQARVGLENLLHFMALISINLGILNLLPIPVLDGGHLFFFMIEAVMRRPLELRHREIAQQVGLAILVGLMAFAFYNDIAREFRGPG